MSHVDPQFDAVPLFMTPCIGGRNENLSAAGVQQIAVKYGSNITIPLASKGDWLIAQSALTADGTITCNLDYHRLNNSDSFDWTVGPPKNWPNHNQPGWFTMFSAVNVCSSNTSKACPFYVSDNYTILYPNGSAGTFTGPSISAVNRSTAFERVPFGPMGWAVFSLSLLSAFAGLALPLL